LFQNFVSDFASTSREEVFTGTEKVQLLNKVICQHFYRQGMLDIAEELSKVNKVKYKMTIIPFLTLSKLIATCQISDPKLLFFYVRVLTSLIHVSPIKDVLSLKKKFMNTVVSLI
jgi:hypothetical protein